jgi:hypothetical protein
VRVSSRNKVAYLRIERIAWKPRVHLRKREWVKGNF